MTGRPPVPSAASSRKDPLSIDPGRRAPCLSRLRCLSWVALMAALLLCWPGAIPPLLAQQRGEDAEAEPPEEVIVTATRIRTAPSQVGSSVSVITAEELEEKQQQFALDALREVPGVDVRRSGGPGSQASIFIRGADSDHTLLMVDGIPVHDVSSPNGTPVFDQLLTGNVARIEVVRGPQSTVYGSDAIGGVVNIITKKGQGPPQATLTLGGGYFGTRFAQADLSGGGEVFNYSVSAGRIYSEGFSTEAEQTTARRNIINNENRVVGEKDAYENTTLAGRFGLELGDTFGVDLFVRRIEAGIDLDTGTDFNLSETHQQQTVNKVEPRLTLLDGLWEQKLGFWKHRIERDNRGTGFVLPSLFKGLNTGKDWQHNFYISEANTFTVGGEVEKQRAESGVSGLPRFRAETGNTAYFLQHQFRLGKIFSGTVGGRRDRHDDFGTANTYRAALALNFTEAGTIVRASGGTGFKAPTLVELFDPSFGSNNPNLRPEESAGYDLGVEQAMFRKTLTAGLTWFHNRIDDMIVAVFDPVTFFFVNTNIEEVTTDGLEAFAAYRPGKRFTARLRHTITETEAQQAASFGVTQGSELLRRPRKTANLDVTAKFLQEKAQITANMLYIGKRLDLDPVLFNTVTAGDYWVVNLAGAYRPLELLEIFLRIENLFDREYQEVLGFTAPGFSVFGGARLRF